MLLPHAVHRGTHHARLQRVHDLRRYADVPGLHHQWLHPQDLPASGVAYFHTHSVFQRQQGKQRQSLRLEAVIVGSMVIGDCSSIRIPSITSIGTS